MVFVVVCGCVCVRVCLYDARVCVWHTALVWHLVIRVEMLPPRTYDTDSYRPKAEPTLSQEIRPHRGWPKWDLTKGGGPGADDSRGEAFF